METTLRTPRGIPVTEAEPQNGTSQMTLAAGKDSNQDGKSKNNGMTLTKEGTPDNGHRRMVRLTLLQEGNGDQNSGNLKSRSPPTRAVTGWQDRKSLWLNHHVKPTTTKRDNEHPSTRHGMTQTGTVTRALGLQVGRVTKNGTEDTTVIVTQSTNGHTTKVGVQQAGPQ